MHVLFFGGESLQESFIGHQSCGISVYFVADSRSEYEQGGQFQDIRARGSRRWEESDFRAKSFIASNDPAVRD